MSTFEIKGKYTCYLKGGDTLSSKYVGKIRFAGILLRVGRK